MIIVNGKFLKQQTTGVQRYASEITKSWTQKGLQYRILEPTRNNASMWEQTIHIAKSDILWCPTNSGPLFERNKIVTIHDGAVFFNPSWFSRGYRYWRRFALPKLAQSSKAIITVSEHSKQIISHYLNVPDSKIHVVYNGVDCDFFKPTPDSKDLLLEYGIDREYLLTVGSLDPRKNLLKTLQAWQQVPKSTKNGHYLVVVGGKPNSFNDIKVSIPDDVILTGYVPDQLLPILYTNATGFLYPSLFEGFGLPVLEAMACNTPVLSSNTTSIPEIAEGAAILINPHSVNAIQEGIEKLLSNESLRLELSANSRNHALKFSWELAARLTWEIIQKAKS